ncbi:hypothetical protein ACT3TA_07165 [Halomonas sp. AOP42-C1-46]|uniref:hypothetical protein n=1 Tax=Halomonas sp. AOP42-C1-46 TaxID=3457671 RepID=UPI004033FF7D
MKNHELETLISDVHNENQSLKDYRKNLNELLKFRAGLKFDHPWLPKVDSAIANCQNLLKIKIYEDQQSLPALIKRSLITETLKFMAPFILGFALALYGIPELSKKEPHEEVQPLKSNQ